MWGGRLDHTVRNAVIVLCCVLFLNACFHDENYPPTANAGADVVASILETITLDGTQSSDPDGDRLTYTWVIADKPENSQVTLLGANVANPQIILDDVGQYVIQLNVSDGEHKSKADFVTITTVDEKPIAVITELSVPNGAHYVAGDTISISAIESSDPEAQNLFYIWEITIKPENSNATLSGTKLLNPTFTVDVAGHYIVHLIVSDGTNLSEAQMMIFEIEGPLRKTDTRPFAEAGSDQALFSSNSLVQLDGSQSYDVENDVLSYRWEMIYKPENSAAQLISSSSELPQFTADVLGNYVIKLVVSDVNGESHIDTVIVTPHDTYGLACGDCHNKPQLHLITNDDCAQCHDLAQWNLVTGIFHAHGHMSKPAQCDICHNGTDAHGKDEHHLITDKDCNHCHLKSDLPWKPALTTPVDPAFQHDGIYSGCTSCHNGKIQQGKPAGHMPVSDRCFACHTTEDWLSGLHLEHTVLFNTCTDCHNDVKAKGKPGNHLVTTQNCRDCHQKTFWSSPKLPTVKFDHAGITAPCVTCHNNVKK